MSAYSDDALDRPIARTDGLATEKVDQELVIYDDASKQAHCLSPAVAAIWALCDGDTSQAGMSEKLGVSFESVAEAVDELSRLGLLVEQTGINRREAAKRFATVGAAAIAGPALISSMAVPAAAAGCSQMTCAVGATSSNAYTDWNDIPQGDSAWFRAVLNSFDGWTPDTTSQLLVTGSVSLPNLNNPVTVDTIPTRITFVPGNGAVTLTYRTDPKYFGGATFADEVVPLGCLGNIFLNGLLYYAAADMGPGGGTKAWYFTLNVTYSGAKIPGAGQGITYQFGASGYSGQPAPPNNGTPAFYNGLDIKPASGACTTVAGGDDVSTPEAITGDHYGGGSGGGGANYTGSNSSPQKCQAQCA